MLEQDWLARVASLVGEVLRSDATEFELVEGTLRVRVRRRAGAAASQLSEVAAAPESSSSLSAVIAPLTGILYLAPTPGTPTFVEVGDWVAAGAVIGLIEAMKVFNEVTTDRAGLVVRIVAEDGSLVRSGQVIMELDLEAAEPPEQRGGRE